MRAYIFSLLLIFFAAGLTAQKNLSGTVVDASTGEPLVYATVSVIGEKGGVYTDARGWFSLLVQEPDSLLITMLGYTPLRTPITDEGTYLLLPGVYTTEEIVVIDQRHKRQREKFGDFRPSNYSFSGWWRGIVARRVGEHTTESGRLMRIFYRLHMHSKSCSVYARVRLFANAGNRPGEELLTKNILVRLRGAKSRYSVDLREEQITFPPGGLYVGIEFLEPAPDCGEVDNHKKRFYVKMAKTDNLKSWIRPQPSSAWRQLGGNFRPGKKYNTCFGVEVEY